MKRIGDGRQAKLAHRIVLRAVEPTWSAALGFRAEGDPTLIKLGSSETQEAQNLNSPPEILVAEFPGRKQHV